MKIRTKASSSTRVLKKISLLGICFCLGLSCYFMAVSGTSGRGALVGKSQALPVEMIPHSAPSAGTIIKNTNAAGVNPKALYSSEPAPMGIADFGINPHDNSAYIYSTTSFLGRAFISSLSTKEGSSDYGASIQLNVVLKFKVGSVIYAYWLQDVAQIDTPSHVFSFLDNIWNLTTYNTISPMASSGISGKGQISPYDSTTFYWDRPASNAPGNDIALTYPATIFFQINSTTSGGKPMVEFSYNDGHGWQLYDWVIFKTGPGAITDWNIIVDGSQYTPTGWMFYDAELVLGGEYGGIHTTDYSSDVDFFLDYYNGHNMEGISSAYDFGSSTGEAISNVVETTYCASSGRLYASVSAGKGSLEYRWMKYYVVVANFVFTAMSGGTLYVGTSPYSFSGTTAQIVIAPGNYSVAMKTTTITNSFTFYAGFNDIYVNYPSTNSIASIRTPASDSSWTAGRSYNLYWKSAGWSSSANIYLYSSNYSCVSTIANASNSAPYNFTIPATGLWSGSYIINMADSSNSYIFDWSEWFYINVPPYISIKSPNATSTWMQGHTCKINWTTYNTSAYVNLFLYDISGHFFSPIASHVSNTGSYSWTVPTNLTDGNYKIYVNDYYNSGIHAISNSFVITSIKITSPMSSDVWIPGHSYSIDWNSYGTSGYVDIYLDDSLGHYISTIATHISDTGSYNWTVPTIADGNYEIYMNDSSNSSIHAYSNVRLGVPNITITSPASWDSWMAESWHYIDWSSFGTSGNVNLYLDDSLGHTISTIVTTVSDTGSYYWRVPYGLTKGNYEISMNDSSNSAIYAYSGTFVIPFITITSPASLPCGWLEARITSTGLRAGPAVT